MFTRLLTRSAGTIGGLALPLAAAAGIAAASPGTDPVVDTTCSYPQVVAAMNAQSPSAAEEFNTTPAAQSFLQNFLASPPPQRQQMLAQAAGIPQAAHFVALIQPIANTCNNY